MPNKILPLWITDTSLYEIITGNNVIAFHTTVCFSKVGIVWFTNFPTLRDTVCIIMNVFVEMVLHAHPNLNFKGAMTQCSCVFQFSMLF